MAYFKRGIFGSLVIISIVSSPVRNLLADDTAAAEGDKTERVEVTGSHIKRIDVEGVSSVQTVTKKQMEVKGYDNLGDVVRDLGVNNFGSSTVSGNSTAPGNADINLRGLGSDNTLVLLNGQRLPQDAITGTVDINLIPIAAVERIEILKDGASAIYGSDALGGVVNIITRKDFQGTELSATQTLPTQYGDGKRTKINAVTGINSEKLNVVTSLGFRYDQPIHSAKRPWSSNGYSLLGNPPSYANAPDAGNGPFMVTSSCPAGQVYTDPAGKYCRFKYSDYSEEAPQITQFGVLSEGRYEASSDVKLNARVNFIHRTASTIAAPSPDDFLLSPAGATRFNPPGWDGTSPLELKLRLTPLGPRNTDVTSNAYGALIGSTIQLPKDWQLEVTTTANLVKSRLEGSSGFALKDKVRNLVNSGAFNPFAAPGNQGDLSSAKYVPYEDTQSILTGLEAKASGDLFKLPAGSVGLAVGSLVNYSNFKDATDPETLKANVFGNAGSSGGGHRSAEALYSELSVPVLEKKLELQLAGRFDHYSDFGSTVNPKVGVLYHAAPSLLLRGSWGTGFRAPLLNELYAAQSISYPSFIDYVACAKNPGTDYCQAQQYKTLSGGNPNLKQERSKSFTLGAIFEPSPTFNVGTDWFYTKISNMPGIDYNDMTLAQQNGVDPTKYGVVINRDPTTGEIINVVAPLQNLSSAEEVGVDVNVGLTLGRVKLATEQNQLFFYKTEGFPGSGLVNKLGWNGLPSWRNATSAGYLIDANQSVQLTALTIAHQKTLDRSGRIPAFTTFDLNYSYKTRKIGEFSLGVINVLGKSPPLDPSNSQAQVNYSLYDPNGRQIVLGYQVRL